jgi:hypothetical protein
MLAYKRLCVEEKRQTYIDEENTFSTEVSDLAFRQIPHMPEVPEASYCSQLLA